MAPIKAERIAYFSSFRKAFTLLYSLQIEFLYAVDQCTASLSRCLWKKSAMAALDSSTSL